MKKFLVKLRVEVDGSVEHDVLIEKRSTPKTKTLPLIPR